MPQENATAQEQPLGLSVPEAGHKIAELFARTGVTRSKGPARTETEKRREPSPPADATDDDDSVEPSRVENEEAHSTDTEGEDTDQSDETTVEDTEETAPDEDTIELDDETFEKLLRARKHRARSNGEDLEVDYDDLVNGYSRTDDYTRKTQRLAELSKARDAEIAKARERAVRLDRELEQVENGLKAMMPQEPNWDQIRKDHPDQYPAIWTDWQRYQAAIADVSGQRKKLAEERSEEQQRERSEYVQGEFEKVLAAVPEWRDPAKRAAGWTSLVDHAKSYGFTDDEMNGVVDSRLVRLFRDAIELRDLKKRQKDAREKAEKRGPGNVKVARPGSGVPRKEASPIGKALGRLAKTGDVNDAGAAFTHLFKAERKRGGRTKE